MASRPVSASARGLKNLGNTCFLNCVLQSLRGVRSLRHYLDRQTAGGNNLPLTVALHRSLADLGNHKATGPVDPREVTRVPTLSDSFRHRRQQDAHELLQKLLTGLQDEALFSFAPPASENPRPATTKAAPRIHLSSSTSTSTSTSTSALPSASPGGSVLPAAFSTSTSAESSVSVDKSFQAYKPSFPTMPVSSQPITIRKRGSPYSSPDSSPSSLVPSSTTSLLSRGDEFGNKLGDDVSSRVSPTSPFSGLLGSDLKCEGCEDWSSQNTHEFVNITLAIPAEKQTTNPSVGAQSCDLLDCLKAYTAVETVGGVECPACTYKATIERFANRFCIGSKSSLHDDLSTFAPTPLDSPHSSSPPATNTLTSLRRYHDDPRFTTRLPLLNIQKRSMQKVLYIARPPEALCFHLHRLTVTERKVYTLVRFPLELDLDPYCKPVDSSPFAPSGASVSGSPSSAGQSPVAVESQPSKPSGRCRGGAGSSLSPPSSQSYLGRDWTRDRDRPLDVPLSQLEGQSQPQDRHTTARRSSSSAFCSSASSSSASSSSAPSSRLYQLVAVIVHHGTSRNGHFETYRREESSTGELASQWIHLSDEKVRSATVEEVLGAPAYMLFYERDTYGQQAHV